MTDKLAEDTVNTRIPRWLKEKLREEARRRLAPMSQIVREAIVEKLQRDVGDENPRRVAQVVGLTLAREL